MSEANPRSVEHRDVHVAASVVRCPFCHDDVEPRANDWVACVLCLARHHTACWGEKGACATCSGTEPLVRAGEDRRPAEAEEAEDPVARLDAAWQRRRESLSIATEGGFVEPSRGDVVVCLVTAAVCLGLTAFMASVGAAPCSPIGVVLASFWLWRAHSYNKKLSEYRLAEDAYRQLRSQLPRE